MYVCMYRTCTHIYQGGAGSVRFVSVPPFSKIHRFGSVRKFAFPGSTRFGLLFLDASSLGPVRFGSFPRPVPAGSKMKRFDSVRFGRFGSVSYSLLLSSLSFRFQRMIPKGISSLSSDSRQRYLSQRYPPPAGE